MCLGGLKRAWCERSGLTIHVTQVTTRSSLLPRSVSGVAGRRAILTIKAMKAMKATPGGGHGLASRAGSASTSATTRPPEYPPLREATVDDIVSELAADTDDGVALEVAWWRTCPDGALPVLSPSSCC